MAAFPGFVDDPGHQLTLTSAGWTIELYYTFNVNKWISCVSTSKLAHNAAIPYPQTDMRYPSYKPFR